MTRITRKAKPKTQPKQRNKYEHNLVPKLSLFADPLQTQDTEKKATGENDKLEATEKPEVRPRILLI